MSSHSGEPGRLSRATWLALGFATMLPVLYVVALVVVRATTEPAPGDRDVTAWIAVPVVVGLDLLLVYVVYLTHAVRHQPQPLAARWLAAMLLGSVFAMLVYWWRHLAPRGVAPQGAG
jgi:hypothetical protein